jgi:hypothetical protein
MIEEIRNGIRELARQGAIQFRPGIIKAVDKAACRCDVQLAEDYDVVLYDVRLRAVDDEEDKGFVLFPAVGSDVIIGQMSSGGWFVSMYSVLDSLMLKVETQTMEVSKDGFVWNGGSLGGLVKIADLVSKLNALEQDINSLKTAFSAWVPVPNDGGAALKTAAGSWSGSQLVQTQKGDLEDTKITH